MRGFIFVALCALLMIGCANHWKTIAYGYRSVRVSKRISEEFDANLKVFLDKTKKTCLEKHKPKTAEMASCLKKSLELSWGWTGEKAGKKTSQGALPNLQKAQAAAKESLDGAFDYLEARGGKCSGSDCDKSKAWIKLLKPSFCASFRLFDLAISAGAVKSITGSSAYSMAKSLHSALCK